LKKEGEGGKEKKIEGRKGPSPFSTVKSPPRSLLSFPSDCRQRPSPYFYAGATAEKHVSFSNI
jgi:hypothetical protein